MKKKNCDLIALNLEFYFNKKFIYTMIYISLSINIFLTKQVLETYVTQGYLIFFISFIKKKRNKAKG